MPLYITSLCSALTPRLVSLSFTVLLTAITLEDKQLHILAGNLEHLKSRICQISLLPAKTLIPIAANTALVLLAWITIHVKKYIQHNVGELTVTNFLNEVA